MNVQRNIVLLYLIKVAKWLMLYMPISFLFYKENSLDTGWYLTLHAIYSGIIALLEVPSGYIADVWGRKPAMVLGTLFGALGFGAYSISYGVTGFLIAEILLGIGSSLLSGADTALLYDTLLTAKKEKKYLKFEGRITAIGNISEALAGICVSIIILSTYRGYFIIQAILALLAFVLALFLVEPVQQAKRAHTGFKDILNIVNTSFRKNKILRNFIVLAAVVGFASLSMAWIAQPIFDELGVNEKHYGMAWVILNTCVALGSLSSDKINRTMGLKGALLFMAVPLSIGFLVLGFKLSLFAVVPLLILFYVRGTAHPILKKYINENTHSNERATVLSLRSLLIRTLFFIMGPILGYIYQKFSLSHALYLCGATVFFPMLFMVTLIFFRSKKG